MTPDLAPLAGRILDRAWGDVPGLALDGTTDDGPALRTAQARTETARRCDLEAWVEEAMRDPLFAWWRRWHNLTLSERAGEKRVAVSMARTRRRAARRVKTARRKP